MSYNFSYFAGFIGTFGVVSFENNTNRFSAPSWRHTKATHFFLIQQCSRSLQKVALDDFPDGNANDDLRKNGTAVGVERTWKFKQDK